MAMLSGADGSVSATENPFIDVRYCTCCNARRPELVPRAAAKYVAVSADGMQWFVCQRCHDLQALSLCDEPALAHMELNQWCREHGLPELDQRGQVRAILNKADAALVEASAVLEGS